MGEDYFGNFKDAVTSARKYISNSLERVSKPEQYRDWVAARDELIKVKRSIQFAIDLCNRAKSS